MVVLPMFQRISMRAIMVAKPFELNPGLTMLAITASLRSGCPLLLKARCRLPVDGFIRRLRRDSPSQTDSAGQSRDRGLMRLDVETPPIDGASLTVLK